MARLGMLLLLLGIAVSIGFGIYVFIREAFTDPAFPLALKIGIPAIALGILILVIAALRDRVRAQRTEGVKEAEP